jgi:hypothetical protein
MSLDKITLLDENTLNYNIRPFRNLIINGDMNIAQRATSVNSITTNGYYTADRWITNISSLSTWTSSVENDSPVGSGLRKSLKTTCNAAISTNNIGENSFATLQYRMEGQHLQVIKKGTSSAENIVISFWVKSNTIGTYILEIYDQDNIRSISKSYTINATGTWEKKIIVFESDTVGTLDNDSNLSLLINFWLSAGSSFTAGILNTEWDTAVNSHRAVGQSNLALNNNNYFQITGVQMEIGNASSKFETVPYEIQLQRCQRYYYKNFPNIINGVFCGAFANSNVVAEGFVKYPVTMRTIPSAIETTGTATDYQIKYLQTSANCTVVPSHSIMTTTECGYLQFTTSTVLTSGHGVTLRTNTANGYLAWSAEL